MERRRMFKAAAVLVTLGYCSLLVYQGGVTFNSQESRSTSEQVSDLSIEPVTKTSITESVPKNITLDDLFITVKTTRHHQYTRLPIILKTWFRLAKKQIWFFTDTDNQQHQQQTNGHMINTNCSSTHQREHLCCKTSVEYDRFLESGKKWWCHFDDDNYVNLPRLVYVLQNYDAMKDWYLGRPSINEPVTVYKKSHIKATSKSPSKRAMFWFGTGGAGYCITRSLGLKMLPVASGGKFVSICEKIRLPDDVTMGFVVEHMVKSKLTFVPEFHSHLEQMKLIAPEALKDQISVSYSKMKMEPGSETQWNVVNVPGFDNRYDPTRLLSLHCFLFPDFKFCPR